MSALAELASIALPGVSPAWLKKAHLAQRAEAGIYALDPRVGAYADVDAGRLQPADILAHDFQRLLS